MHSNSLLSTIKGTISNAMKAQIAAQALYTNAVMKSNVGFNTKERSVKFRIASECIICNESKCGSDAHPESGRCI